MRVSGPLFAVATQGYPRIVKPQVVHEAAQGLALRWREVVLGERALYKVAGVRYATRHADPKPLTVHALTVGTHGVVGTAPEELTIAVNDVVVADL